jgi:hypothetical protein
MEYNFKEYQGYAKRKYVGLSLSLNGIMNCSKDVKRMINGDKVIKYIDINNRAILLKPDSNGQPFRNVGVLRESGLPAGRYIFTEKTNEGGLIFVYQNQALTK